MAVSTLAGIAVARNGGPLGYAVFVAANMLVFVSSVLCSFGLPLALAKHVAAEEEVGRHEALRRSSTTMILCLLLITLISGLALSVNLWRLEEHLHITIGRGFAIAFPFVMLCAVISDCAQGIYFGLLRPRPVIAITASGPVIVILYILARNAGLPLPIWGAVAALYATSGLVACYRLWRDRLLGVPSPIGEIKPILKDLAPAAVFTFFTIFSTWSDRWIVGTQLGAIAMGSYAAAGVIIQAALRVPTHIAYLLVPASARVALRGAEKGMRFNRSTVGIFGLCAASMTVAIMLAPASIVRLVFGPGFLLAAPVLLIMTPSLLTAAFSIPFISALTGSTKNRLVICLLGITILPRMLLLLFFTRYWSVLGTALATVLSDSLLALCCILFARKIGMAFPLRALAQPYLLGVLAYGVGFATLLLGAPQLVAVAVAVLIFAPALSRCVRTIYAPAAWEAHCLD